MTINDKARIERILRQLDPDDIRLLSELDAFDDPGFAPDPKNTTDPGQQRAAHNNVQRLMRAQTKPLSQNSLQAAGCLTIDYGGWGAPAAHVTALGRQLLRVLEEFVREPAP